MFEHRQISHRKFYFLSFGKLNFPRGVIYIYYNPSWEIVISPFSPAPQEISKSDF